jgi:hypothetical protein
MSLVAEWPAQGHNICSFLIVEFVLFCFTLWSPLDKIQVVTRPRIGCLVGSKLVWSVADWFCCYDEVGFPWVCCAIIVSRDRLSGRLKAARVKISLRFLGPDIATCILLNGIQVCRFFLKIFCMVCLWIPYGW